MGRYKGEYYPVDTPIDLMKYREVMCSAKVSVLDKCAYGTVQHDDETYVCTGNTVAELVLDFQILVDALSGTGKKAEGVKRAHKPDNGCEMPNPLNKMEYRGLTGGAEVSVEDGCLYGKILVEKDLVLYEGNPWMHTKKSLAFASKAQYNFHCASLCVCRIAGGAGRPGDVRLARTGAERRGEARSNPWHHAFDTNIIKSRMTTPCSLNCSIEICLICLPTP